MMSIYFFILAISLELTENCVHYHKVVTVEVYQKTIAGETSLSDRKWVENETNRINEFTLVWEKRNEIMLIIEGIK